MSDIQEVVDRQKWQDISAVWQAQLVAHCEPKSPRVLHKYIKNLLGFHVPTEAPTEGQTSPFAFVSAAFFQEFERGLVLASRGGGKTRNVAVLNLLASRFRPGTHTVHFGAVGRQGAWGHEYLRDMVRARHQSDVVEKSERGIVLWRNGSWVRPATGHTDTGVSAIRCNRAVFDEVDLWQLKLFEMAMLMVQGTPTNPAQTICISTQYSAYGLMGQLLRQAERRGFRVYRWDVFASMQRCEKCLEDKCPLFIWENPRTNAVEPLCQGRGLRADGYVPREAIVDEFIRMGHGGREWAIEKLLEEPLREHLILDFQEDRHVGVAPEEVFAEGAPRACGVDWGYDHPAAFVVVTEVGDRYWVMHEHSERFMTPDREVEVAKELDAKFGPGLIFYCGSDRPEAIANLVEHGLIAAPCPVRAREARHRALRRLLRRDPLLEGSRLMFDGEKVPVTIWQTSIAHRDEKTGNEVVDQDNDTFDALEYVMSTIEFSDGISSGGFFMT